MKKLFPLLVTVLIAAFAFAQSPEKMSYQAVLRNAGNELLQNKPVGMQISVLQGNTAIYVETQTPSTNENGLVTLQIGTGTVLSGNFSAIDWGNGSYFIKTETDLTGGSTYSISGTSQLLSVPYALHAKTAASIEGDLYLGADSTVELTGVISNKINALTSSSGNISWTGAEGNLYSIELTEDAVLENPSTPITGATYMFLINQNSSGQWTLSYGDKFIFPGGIAPVIDLNTNSKNLMTTIFDGTDFLVVSIKNFL
ncbi:hypothetical protein [Polaribacter glomeratus]|uniref:Lipocalin-like domain-containing protein n=1 Tax=Polaribacter glomeratus TaxID=102 RepID=A0A2S7WVT7_9FLAO|nr:hypothetical protein [Polaribacter glomeratus]PQJ81720.1 hypothetical protein BTO16_03670 [Polaribacter glomeratus]TXD66355.1 hypothetical protein ESX12_06105 [Polaribacter glomeratus]